jgi:hypothetical protein
MLRKVLKDYKRIWKGFVKRIEGMKRRVKSLLFCMKEMMEKKG